MPGKYAKEHSEGKIKDAITMAADKDFTGFKTNIESALETKMKEVLNIVTREKERTMFEK